MKIPPTSGGINLEKVIHLNSRHAAPPVKPDDMRESYAVLRIIEEQDLQRTLDMAGRPWRRWNEIFFSMFSDDLPIQPPPPRYPNARAQQTAHRLRQEALGWSQ